MSTNKIKCSVIIAIFNEERHLTECIRTLINQTIQNLELIIVDDGSIDRSKQTAKKALSGCHLRSKVYSVTHRGPGECRNFGASKASGEIIVFLDGDMYFNSDFVEKLLKPMLNNRTIIGTESQNELLANPDNYWGRCWNMGRFASAGNFSCDYLWSMVPDKTNFGGVFRAIRKRDFDRVGGFDIGGDYSDDESLVRKIGSKSTLANEAIFYHYNPDSMIDVWNRARWIGSDRKLNRGVKKYLNLVKFSLPISIANGIVTGLRFNYLPYVFFKIIFDTSIWMSVLKSI